MDRRLIGALLVVAVLTVAVVLPARDGLGIAGTGSPIALPAEPRVGDCLLTTYAGFEPASESNPRGVSSGGRGTASPASQVPLNFGSCRSGEVAGEVLAVLSAAGDEATRRARIRAIGPDCQRLAFAYAGLLPTEDNDYRLLDPPAGPVTWNLAVNLRQAWILPDRISRAAGRTWAACVAGPAYGGRYEGRLLGAYDGGRLPDGFGNCWDQRTVTVAMRQVDCGAPHQSEVISMGWVPPQPATVTRADIESSCYRLASLVMDRADPTASGQLQIRINPDSDPPRVNRRLDIICYVVPTERSLAGTLVGLGDRPVPLTD
jgi:hypothetical protein